MEGLEMNGAAVIEEFDGTDLFTCDAEASMCHCVSADLAMGKGIAVLFKSKFGKLNELEDQKAGVGGGALLKKPGANNAFVYYLVTKKFYWGKPTLDTLRQSLLWMKRHALEHHVTCIAMPRISCGLDGLHWDDVRKMLIELFQDMSIRIQVFVL